MAVTNANTITIKIVIRKTFQYLEFFLLFLRKQLKLSKREVLTNFTETFTFCGQYR